MLHYNLVLECYLTFSMNSILKINLMENLRIILIADFDHIQIWS